MNPEKYNLSINYDSSNVFDLKLATNTELNVDDGSLNNDLITDCLLFYYDFNVYQNIENIYTLVNGDFIFTTGFMSSGATMYLSGDTLINRQIIITSGGSLNSNYVPQRNKDGFSLNFLLDKRIIDNDGVFFEMGTPLINGISFIYTGDYVGYNELLPRQDESGNTFTKNVITGTSVVLHDSPWTDLCITYKRDESLTFCRDLMNWVPEPTIISVYTGCTGCTATTTDYTYIITGYTALSGFTGCTCESTVPSTQCGTIKFFINGRPVFEGYFEEPILTSGDTGFSVIPDFNGKIGLGSMYTKPLTIPEVIRNYNYFNNIYNIGETFGGPKIIVSGDLTNL